MSEELKPCPFCAADATMAYRTKAIISCTACPATMTVNLPLLRLDLQEPYEKRRAAESWNRRNAMKEGR